MPFRNCIMEYYHKITHGEIVAGKWILLIYEIIVRGLEKGEFVFSAKKRIRPLNSSKTFAIIVRGAKIY